VSPYQYPTSKSGTSKHVSISTDVTTLGNAPIYKIFEIINSRFVDFQTLKT
jgi:hypothetical protein